MLLSPPPAARLVAFLLLVLAFAAPAFAQLEEQNILVALAPIDRQSPVALTALTLDAAISESDGHTLVSGTTTWKVHNTDTLKPVTLTVGFPSWAGGSYTFDPTKFTVFNVTLDNKKVAFNPGSSDVRIGEDARTVPWYVFELKLNADEKKTITAQFTQDLGTGPLPRLVYGLLSSNRWKNALGSARLTVTFPEVTSGEQFIALDPSVPKFDGRVLTWLLVEHNPSADVGVTFIRPSLWRDLGEKRATAAQNPDDVEAHFQLGQIYKELAAQESPRRDNFMAQAVAEFETAARLDPANGRASRTLAELYETRAGAPNGPRDATYVMLAMEQWQKVLGAGDEAAVRKQLAEDNFYLGLDAKSRQQYDQALAYFEAARTLASQGAGPLYTREHWENEYKTTRLAAAETQVAQGRIVQALEQANAALGKFDFAPALPPPAFALYRADVMTRPNEREIIFRFVPYPAPSDEARQTLAQIGAAWTSTGQVGAALGEDGGYYLLKLTVPFDSAANLKARLERLAGDLPDRADWALVRAALVPQALELEIRDDSFVRAVHYREQVSLESGQQQIQGNLNELSRVIGELSKAPKEDAQAQLRLALLTNAQQWWYRALAALVLNYQLDPGMGAGQNWSVSVGTTRTLEYDSEALRPEWQILGAVVAGVVVAVALFVLILLARRRPRPTA